MATKRQPVEEILTSEEFITSSDCQGYLEDNNNVADCDFVGNQNDYMSWLDMHQNCMMGKALNLT